MRMSVIVPVRDDAERLARCLASIAGREQDEIIVADNGSRDDSPGVAARAGATVLSLPHLKVSALRNAAARQAQGDLLAFIDADHQLGPGWVDAALDTMRDPSVGAAGSRYAAPANGTWVQQMYGLLRGTTTGIADTDWLGSGNMVVRREAFDRVGGFDASLEACEDVDLCRRLRGAGFRIVGDERLHSIHHGDPPTLRALFRAERWRGRDNLRVSLRGPVAWREWPSIVMPILSLAALITLALSPLVAALTGWTMWRLAFASAMLILVLAVVRALKMARSVDRPSFVVLARAFAAALVYDTARAIALIDRAPHHRR
jgi:cellulose synthase/poly-beta-1,6-N-acetylglucosamine synthase-like glycosyltransferase